jgi:hypothetical protein
MANIAKAISEAFSKVDFSNVYENFALFREGLKKMPEVVKKSQDKLFSRGWYVFGELALSDLIEVDELSDDEIENLMVGYGSNIKQNTLNRVQALFPHRFNILSDAFQAHDNELYSLSIPVLLSQADGISQELFNVSLYSKNHGEPKTKKARINKIQENFEEDSLSEIFFLRPLDVITSLNINTSDRDEIIKHDSNFGPLNRHGVIHGLDLDYASESNSFRCIILIEYLLDIKTEFFC